MKNEFWLTFLEIVLLFGLVFLPIRLFLFEPFIVRGESMEPNFHNWDYLIIDKLTYRFRKPQRGEIIIFHPPPHQKVYYIKRVIGLPKERIVIDEAKITIFNDQNPSGFVLNETYIKNHYTLGKIDVTLDKDEYFVLGDNREISYDSRKWGPVKRENIIGKVLLQISLTKLVYALEK